MKAARKLHKVVEPIPKGFHTITPELVLKDAGKAIDYYKKAFGARELMRMHAPDGKTVVHAELEIGTSRFFLADEMPGCRARSPQSTGALTGTFFLYVEDVDSRVKKAVDAGGRLAQPVTDMFWGDRVGTVDDPFGYQWTIATHKEDVSPAEARKRGEAFFKEMGNKPQ